MRWKGMTLHLAGARCIVPLILLIIGGAKMRFSFGANWKAFSSQALDETSICEAREAFSTLTNGIDFRGKRFLDVGYGQGLALFLAMEKGARAYGIDIDPLCEQALAITHRHFAHLPRPTTQTVSILDSRFIRSALSEGGYDIVHSWGALHHTGDMKRAFESVAGLVRPDGALILAIYNHHWSSPIWKRVKIIYNRVPPLVQKGMFSLFYPIRYIRHPLGASRKKPQTSRGMSYAFDLRDWLGGYPYEYALREEIITLFGRYGFEIVHTTSSAGWTGCNQFVFRRS